MVAPDEKLLQGDASSLGPKRISEIVRAEVFLKRKCWGEMSEQPKKSRFNFSLRTLIIGLTLVALIAAFIAYNQRSQKSHLYHTRHSAPDYVPDMIAATEVRWILESDKKIGIFWEVDFPPHPAHRYFVIGSMQSSKGKHLLISHGPNDRHGKAKVVNGKTTVQRIISAERVSSIGDFYISKKVELKDAKIWVEIRIIDEFDNVLYHGLKESEPYPIAAERAKQEGKPVYSPSP